LGAAGGSSSPNGLLKKSGSACLGAANPGDANPGGVCAGAFAAGWGSSSGSGAGCGFGGANCLGGVGGNSNWVCRTGRFAGSSTRAVVATDESPVGEVSSIPALSVDRSGDAEDKVWTAAAWREVP
jgi:hypothetical protein